MLVSFCAANLLLPLALDACKDRLMDRSPFAGRTGDPPEREIESRIPGLYRIVMVIIVIIPKMVISVALLFFGGKLVLRSDDSAEVIMNSLAAYFVAGMPYDSLSATLSHTHDEHIVADGVCVCVCVEMDEYVYTYLCPKAIQKILREEDTFPPLNMKVCPRIRCGSGACGLNICSCFCTQSFCCLLDR